MINGLEIKKEEKSFSTQPGDHSDKYFFGRVSEIELLHKYFDDRKHCVLRADRQHGKTALAVKAMERYNQDTYFVRVDLKKSASINGLRNLIMNSFIDTITGEHTHFKTVKALVSAMGGKIKEFIDFKFKGANIEAILGSSAENQDNQKNIENFMGSIELIDKISTSRDKKIILFLDEIQSLIKISGGDYNLFADQFRALVKSLNSMVIVAAGSEQSLVNKMVNGEDVRFLMEMEDFKVESIDINHFKEHLEKACSYHEVYYEPDIYQYCYTLTGGIASELAYFGDKILSLSSDPTNKVNSSDILKIAVKRVENQKYEYKKRLNNLKSIDQDLTVFTMVVQGVQDIEDYETLEKLEERSFIRTNEDHDYVIVDPLLLIYIKAETKPQRNSILKKIDNGDIRSIEETNNLLLGKS